MPGPKPPNVPLSEAERAELQVLVRAQKTSQHIALRARIILLLADGLTAPAVARRLQTTRTTVRLWRRRWLEGAATTVLARLQDDPRPGAPLTFSAEQWCQIMALACEPPEQSERPISHWTPRELAEEAVTRQCVASISPRHVGRFLTSGGVNTPSQPVLAQCGPGPRGRDEDR
jgi:transposase